MDDLYLWLVLCCGLLILEINTFLYGNNRRGKLLPAFCSRVKSQFASRLGAVSPVWFLRTHGEHLITTHVLTKAVTANMKYISSGSALTSWRPLSKFVCCRKCKFYFSPFNVVLLPPVFMCGRIHFSLPVGQHITSPYPEWLNRCVSLRASSRSPQTLCSAVSSSSALARPCCLCSHAGLCRNVAANPLPSRFAVPTSHFRSISKNGTRPRRVVSETEGNKEGAEEAGG